jgi:multiple sugar transport system permease protein
VSIQPALSVVPERAGARPRFGWLSERALMHLFLWPTLLLLLFITIFPLLWSLYLSFTEYSVVHDSSWTVARWVGLGNYRRLLADAEFWTRFRISASFVVPTVLVEFLLGFGIALLLHRLTYGRGFLSTIILIPMMLAPVVVALFWRFMLQGDIGIVNYFIRDVLGLPGVPWLTERNWAIVSMILVDTWQWTPFMMLISLAGLSAVPKYLYEAADVDRASGWFKFRHITLPLVTPLLLIGILFRLMDTYKLFELAFVLTGGGPGDYTKVLPLYLYRMAFGDFDTGRASAVGYIMLIVIIALANLLIRLLNQMKAEER